MPCGGLQCDSSLLVAEQSLQSRDTDAVVEYATVDIADCNGYGLLSRCTVPGRLYIFASLVLYPAALCSTGVGVTVMARSMVASCVGCAMHRRWHCRSRRQCQILSAAVAAALCPWGWPSAILWSCVAWVFPLFPPPPGDSQGGAVYPAGNGRTSGSGSDTAWCAVWSALPPFARAGMSEVEARQLWLHSEGAGGVGADSAQMERRLDCGGGRQRDADDDLRSEAGRIRNADADMALGLEDDGASQDGVSASMSEYKGELQDARECVRGAAGGETREGAVAEHGRGASEGAASVSEDAGSSIGSTAANSDCDSDPDFLNVSPATSPTEPTEQDIWDLCARRLAEHLRPRPTLPENIANRSAPALDVTIAVELPLYSCPFRGCTDCWDDRLEFLRHIGSCKGPHHEVIKETCDECFDFATALDFVYLAMSLQERDRIPAIGMATTRRALRTLTTRYNDQSIKALVCFVCGCIHTTLQGYESWRFQPENASREDEQIGARRDIELCDSAFFTNAEQARPGTLLNNCSYELWCGRYKHGRYQSSGGPHERDVLAARSPCQDGADPERALSEWCIRLPIAQAGEVKLFGITEDVCCQDPEMIHEHGAQEEGPEGCRRLCASCLVPVCSGCRSGFWVFGEVADTGSIATALANDNYYGYARKLLVQEKVTWLECAAASLMWTTIMVYYLEQPHGHLMLESLLGAEGRTFARGNLFSFALPWEDIEEQCEKATGNWEAAGEEARRNVTLPHPEEVLAALVNVHVVGGAKDIVECLAGATMRIDVVRGLIGELRQSGYAGYTADFNSDRAVEHRMAEMYPGQDRETAFVPKAIKAAAEKAYRAKLTGTSLIYDKNATPAEPISDVKEFERQSRPLSLVAQRSSMGASTVHEEHGNIMARYQTLEVITGSDMLNQHQPHYLGAAYPFTMPIAVGGYDVPGKPRWRRPSADALDETMENGDTERRNIVPLTEPYWQAQEQVPAAKVKLFDLARSMPRRIEAQYRRHWSYVPGLWNLYFREQVNLGASLRAVSRGTAAEPQDQTEQDAGVAAADLYEKLHTGYYLTQTGNRCKIDGDVSKLRFAVGVTSLQKRLLADFSFRTRAIGGTQEIRGKIGQICFWGSVVYGNGIFMTISPGERHNYLAIRLSRYRRRDPYITSNAPDERDEAPWIGADAPSLEAGAEDRFSFEVPGYDLRRLILARDPLAAALAFSVQIRCQLATLFGIRMCPDCPHCAESENPCQDAFGSNAEAMGGLAGRSDGLAGAVECQKKSGCLHLHFWNFVQRAHQQKTLLEIANLLEQAFITAADMKQFAATLCCESYPDETALDAEIEELETRWPRFHEKDETRPGEVVRWGPKRFGRLAPFLFQRAGPKYRRLHDRETSEQQRNETMRKLREDAEQYQAKFNEALQENMKCAQHHIHKRDAKSGKRTLPNACQSFRAQATCKHDFPLEAKVNTGPALLVCKGVARKRGLKLSGTRAMLGSILGKRNSAWIDGTAPGLCVGFSGCNTDVKLNDRVPILPCTHEDAHCDRRCVPRCSAKRKRALTKMIRKMQTAQSQINGYFGGYIGKRQRCGRLETKKCVDKMHALRDRNADRSEFQQQRAVSGRMITDIESNGTLRGAVEEFNLCANLRANDVLFAECVRTFSTVSVNAQQWFHRLAVEQERLQEMQVSTVVPPTRKPNARSLRSKAPWVDIYGFRPLDDTPFSRLSPFEFLQYWNGEALAPPWEWNDSGRTEWTDDGALALDNGDFRSGKTKVLPGVHYVVVENDGDEYFTFQNTPYHIFGVLRHSWVITRRPRPHVPILEGVPVPSPAKPAEDNAKYFSLFFRPWTLHAPRDGIPHLAQLGLSGAREGDDGRQEAASAKLGNSTNFKNSWQQYIRGNVMSRHAARLISSVMTMTLAKSSEFEHEEADEADRSDIDDDIPPLRLGPAAARRIFRTTHADNEERPGQQRRPARFNMQTSEGMRLVRSIWDTKEGQQEEDEEGDANGEGPMYVAQAKRHIAARRVTKDAEEDHPYCGKSNPKAELYGSVSPTVLETWFESLAREEEPPTAEQIAFLRAVAQRIRDEAWGEQHDKRKDVQSEPMFDVVHGVPGAGKSRLITWLRRMFEEVMHWQHGVQFVCLAYQNAMAAHINGFTVHHWTGIPVGDVDGAATTRDAHIFSTRCQSLRFVIIDEISMISAQMLAQIDLLTAKVVRKRSGYKTRADGSVRPFGGLNILLFGDWWQLKPVSGTALFGDPREAPTQTAYHGMQLLWGSPPNAVHRCWHSEESLRCDDVWYNDFLGQCRRGDLEVDTYNLFQGYPTTAPVSVLDRRRGLHERSATATSIDECTCQETTGRHQRAHHGDPHYYRGVVRT